MRWMTATRRDRGAAALIVTILFSSGVLIGCAALTVDVGQLYSERRQLQNGADAAALSLAKVCATGGTCSYAGANAVALGANRHREPQQRQRQGRLRGFQYDIQRHVRQRTVRPSDDSAELCRAERVAASTALLDRRASWRTPPSPTSRCTTSPRPARAAPSCPPPSDERSPASPVRRSPPALASPGDHLVAWDRATSRSPCRDVTGCTPRVAPSAVAGALLPVARSTERLAVRSTATAAPGSPRGQTRRPPRRRRSPVTRSSCWYRTRLVVAPCQRPARRGKVTHFQVASGFSTPFLPTRVLPSSTRSTGCTRRPATTSVATSTTSSAR